jgi:CheY-like chemotaxis protein
MALSMANELANLATAVEGRAHHLIEAAPARSQLPTAAEAMLASIARLRGLHTKLIAFGRARDVVNGITEIDELITSLSDELQQMQLGLELRWDPPDDLPSINACPAATRDALLFLCSALLQVERGATRLTFTVERSFSNDEPEIVIEVHLEWVNVAASRKRKGMSKSGFALDYEAAKHLIKSHNGELTMEHLPGQAVHALVRLPMAIIAEHAADRQEITADTAERSLVTEASAASTTITVESSPETEKPTPPDPKAHQFGGALVLESDPALRAVLASELKASGRAVFACADGASAHTFLETTPDRFELLIVDDANQLDEYTPLARTIRQHTPNLKICLLAQMPTTSSSLWPDLHCLPKPFGVHELRDTLASILAVR